MNSRHQARRLAQRAGFTLIEILLVVSIIGMLAAIAAVNIPKFGKAGKVNKTKADVSNIGVAIEAYNMVEGKYPASLEEITSGNEPYMRSIPNDPWQHPYVYAPSSSHGMGFDLYSMGPDGSPSEDDIGNWNLDKK